MPGPRYDTKKCMGKVLIVKNQFGKEKKVIEIENQKVNELAETFGKLGFTVLPVEENKTKEEMIKLMKDVAAKDLKDDYCFICVVLAYGQDGVITCIDGDKPPKYPTARMQLPVSELQECLKGEKCKDLLLKPKIFMLQLEEVPRDLKDGLKPGAEAPKLIKIPREADFLTYSCKKDYAITTWNDGLKRYVLKSQQPGPPLEIQKLLTRINRLYCDYYSKAGMTVDIPCVTSLLTREVYLKKEEPSQM